MRSYCNVATREAFQLLWASFFKVVRDVTGKPLQFKAFHPTGTLLSVHLDAELAQAQGLADEIIENHNEPATTQVDNNIGNILSCILRFCDTHEDRLVCHLQTLLL